MGINTNIYERLNQLTAKRVYENDSKLNEIDFDLASCFGHLLDENILEPLPNGYAYKHFFDDYIGERIDFLKIENNTLIVLGSVELKDLKVDNYWNKIENYGRTPIERDIIDTYFVSLMCAISEHLVQKRIDYLKDLKENDIENNIENDIEIEM